VNLIENNNGISNGLEKFAEVTESDNPFELVNKAGQSTSIEGYINAFIEDALACLQRYCRIYCIYSAICK